MEDGTARRSLFAVCIIAVGIVLIGAGCKKEELPSQQIVTEVSEGSKESPVVEKAELMETTVPFVACYRGESDLFLSTGQVSDVWIEQLRAQINEGWFVDIWCRETNESGMSRYAFGLRKTQGLTLDELKMTSSTIQNSGYQDEAPTLESDSQLKDWSILRLGYVSSERNRANEMPFLFSDQIAIKNGGLPIDAIEFMRDVEGAVTSPRHVVAEVHGGENGSWFMARIRFNSNTKIVSTDAYCRTYFDSEDGEFSPDSMKTECKNK
jgi:hypothetical protein